MSPCGAHCKTVGSRGRTTLDRVDVEGHEVAINGEQNRLASIVHIDLH